MTKNYSAQDTAKTRQVFSDTTVNQETSENKALSTEKRCQRNPWELVRTVVQDIYILFRNRVSEGLISLFVLSLHATAVILLLYASDFHFSSTLHILFSTQKGVFVQRELRQEENKTDQLTKAQSSREISGLVWLQTFGFVQISCLRKQASWHMLKM